MTNPYSPKVGTKDQFKTVCVHPDATDCNCDGAVPFAYVVGEVIEGDTSDEIKISCIFPFEPCLDYLNPFERASSFAKHHRTQTICLATTGGGHGITYWILEENGELGSGDPLSEWIDSY